MTLSCETHRKAMLGIMKYCRDTPTRGWILKPRRKWDGKTLDIEIELTGEADSNYATCTDTPLQTGIPQSLGVAICLPARREFFPPCAPILHSLAATYLPPMFPAMHPSFARYLRRHLFREQYFTLGKGSTTGIK